MGWGAQAVEMGLAAAAQLGLLENGVQLWAESAILPIPALECTIYFNTFLHSDNSFFKVTVCFRQIMPMMTMHQLHKPTQYLCTVCWAFSCIESSDVYLLNTISLLMTASSCLLLKILGVFWIQSKVSRDNIF